MKKEKTFLQVSISKMVFTYFCIQMDLKDADSIF